MSNESLDEDGTTKHGKPYHARMISCERKTFLSEVKYVEDGCATAMLKARKSPLLEITMY